MKQGWSVFRCTESASRYLSLRRKCDTILGAASLIRDSNYPNISIQGEDELLLKMDLQSLISAYLDYDKFKMHFRLKNEHTCVYCEGRSSSPLVWRWPSRSDSALQPLQIPTPLMVARIAPHLDPLLPRAAPPPLHHPPAQPPCNLHPP